MIKNKDLIAILQSRNPESLVGLMTQRKQPFENAILGVVEREEMSDQRFRFERGISADDLFIVVGKRVRPGSLSAWIVAEHTNTLDHRATMSTQSESVGAVASDAASSDGVTSDPGPNEVQRAAAMPHRQSREDAAVRDIAEGHLRLETIEVQECDRLDFKEHHVSAIVNALRLAYRMGFTAACDAFQGRTSAHGG
jgi:hypothetical protein